MAAAALLVTAMLGANAAPPQCLRALAPIAAQSVPQRTDFEAAACPGGHAADPFRYEAARGVTLTARPIAIGEIVRPFPEFAAAMVRPGDKLELVSAAGGVRIERDVEAMQTARPGQRLFVKAADGQIISVRFEEVRP
jgi:hypothetical protein